MLRLLTIEFYKLKHNKASVVLISIYFCLLMAITLIATIEFSFFGKTIHVAEQGIFNFPYVWHFNTYVAAILKFFLLLVIVSMTANEYSYKTIKQNLIDGLSKKEFILSKFYTVIAFALISTVFIFIVSFILGIIYSDFNEIGIIFSDLGYLLAFFIKLVSFFSLGLFFGILVKRSAFAVGGIVVLLIGENIFRGYLFWIFKGAENSTEKVNRFMQFLPLESMTNLIKEPFSRLGPIKSAANQLGGAFTKEYAVEFSTICIVSVWIFMFIYFSYVLIKRRDL